MVPSLCGTEIATYAVEVSGWDRDQVFFVEKTDLEWNQSFGKQLVLSRALRDKAIIFVRLLQPNGSNQSYPLAYEAIAIEGTTAFKHCYRLNAMQPRPKNV